MTRFKNKTIWMFIAILAVVIVSGMVFFSKHKSTDTAADKTSAAKNTNPKPALSVKVIQPNRLRIPVMLAANGTVSAWQEASIGSEASGLRLTDVRVNVGDIVQKNQILAVYADETIQADVAEAQANLMTAKALASQDSANADRARSLDASGALSKQEISLYLTNEKVAQAKVAAAQATLNAQKLRLKYTQVLAPDDGIISARSATVGAVVAGGTELFKIIRQGRLEWRAEVTSDEVDRVHIGDVARIKSVSGVDVIGHVRMIAPTVNPQTRMALIYIDLPVMKDATSPIKSGMYARGELELGASNALTLPQTAVVMRDGFNYIFNVNKDNYVQRIKVNTGRLVGDQIEILTPIQPDAKIVATGASFLNDGDFVRVVEPKPQSTIAAR
jgi:RND family efflux transporter MFP subunit